MSDFSELARRMATIGQNFYRRGWVLGTSGNFSAVVEREPLRLAITPSGAEKGSLSEEEFLEIDATGNVLRGEGLPSSEAHLHVTVVRMMGAGAVLHTHSVWSNILSEREASRGGVPLEGHEMLKGLRGVTTHIHVEWVPILENSQDYEALAQNVSEMLKWYPNCHGFLLRRHGLYTWGNDLTEAMRHAEILEYLLEVTGRTSLGAGGGA